MRSTLAGVVLTSALLLGSAIPAAAHTKSLLQTAADDLHGIGVTGVQGLTRVDGRVSVARAGFGDVAKGTPVPLGGTFRMGSDTKTFVAVVLLQLVGEGRLTLDDTVEHWLPGLIKGNGNDGRTVTVRDVLQQTSGLPDYLGDVPSLGSQPNYLAHRLDHFDAADLVALAMQHEPEFAAGTHWSYSNTNYIVAGMIIKRVTGHSWDQEVRARVLKPLGLRDTSFPGDRTTVPGPHAQHYQQWAPGEDLNDVTVLNPTVADAAGGLVSTTGDLARFWQALQAGRLLKPAQMRQMHDTVLAETFQGVIPGMRYGLGIMFIPNRCGGYWAHWGDIPGSSTLNAVSADGSRVAVINASTEFADARQGAVRQREFTFLDDAICG